MISALFASGAKAIGKAAAGAFGGDFIKDTAKGAISQGIGSLIQHEGRKRWMSHLRSQGATIPEAIGASGYSALGGAGSVGSEYSKMSTQAKTQTSVASEQRKVEMKKAEMQTAAQIESAKISANAQIESARMQTGAKMESVFVDQARVALQGTKIAYEQEVALGRLALEEIKTNVDKVLKEAQVGTVYNSKFLVNQALLKMGVGNMAASGLERVLRIMGLSPYDDSPQSLMTVLTRMMSSSRTMQKVQQQVFRGLLQSLQRKANRPSPAKNLMNRITR